MGLVLRSHTLSLERKVWLRQTMMGYCSNVETSEGPTARLRRLATLRKRKQRAGATEKAKTEEKLRGREQKQRREI